MVGGGASPPHHPLDGSTSGDLLVERSAEALLVAGTLILVYGFILGVPMAQARMKSPTAPRHLVNTHLEALMAGAALLGLSFAASFSTLGSGLERIAAWLLVAGTVSTLAGGTVNWRTQADDQFAARSAGFYLQAAGGPMVLVGGVLLAMGVLKSI